MSDSSNSSPSPPEDEATPPASTRHDKSLGLGKSASESAESDFAEGGETYVSEGKLVAPENAYSGLRPRDLGKALVGQKIDSVILEEFVGGGGMGAVFRGRDVALQRSVAVKVLATHNANGGDVSKRFAIEAQSAARLDHPNIARIYHVGEADGLHYIVFEFIEGQNLRDLVSDYGPQHVKNVLSYGIQLADALAHASQRQVVHRDIKPSNILVTPAGQAKLVDMGLARLHQVEAGEQDLTATGATLGTFDYIAPEQARDPRDADIRSDIYSLGCTLYYLLVGKPPFPDGTALQKLLRHQGDQPPDIRAERPDMPRSFARVLEKMLAKRPEARQQDPVQLVRELWTLAQTAGLNVTPTAMLSASSPTTPIDFWRRHTPWIAAVALLLVLVFSPLNRWSPAAPGQKFDPVNSPAIKTPSAPLSSPQAIPAETSARPTTISDSSLVDPASPDFGTVDTDATGTFSPIEANPETGDTDKVDSPTATIPAILD